MRSALGYVELAARTSGPIPRRVAPAYVWGSALTELASRSPDARIVNLETSVTSNDEPWPKGINYRMHPDNVACLKAAQIDCTVLANNHVLDWEEAGLRETLDTLHRARILTAGAGADFASAAAPAIVPLADGARLLVFAAATDDSGVPAHWAATASRPGVHRLADLSPVTVAQVKANVARYARSEDRVIFSVHWGGNWGYAISAEKRAFSHALLDDARVDLVHGHSSHHVKALEVHRGHLILYGCGDFLTDYEGISGNEEYRGTLGLMYFPALDRTDGHLVELTMVPTHVRCFRVSGPEEADRRWLFDTLRRECRRYGSDVEERRDGSFSLNWAA
jgi:poly-gamma-glutamate synthesis protein (capsule biosynthesis protein)